MRTIPPHLAAWRRHTLVNATLLASGLAGILLAVACVMALGSVDRGALRAEALYWAFLTPAALWASTTASFGRWAIRWFAGVTLSMAVVGFVLSVVLGISADSGSGQVHALVLAALAGASALGAAASARRREFRAFVVDVERGRHWR